jgi:hypothetical protein
VGEYALVHHLTAKQETNLPVLHEIFVECMNTRINMFKARMHMFFGLPRIDVHDSVEQYFV